MRDDRRIAVFLQFGVPALLARAAATSFLKVVVQLAMPPWRRLFESFLDSRRGWMAVLFRRKVDCDSKRNQIPIVKIQNPC